VANACQLLVRIDTVVLSGARIQLDLLAIDISCSAWVAQVAANDLVTSHHDIGSLARPAHLACIARHLNSLVIR